jgi:hypothetical protein
MFSWFCFLMCNTNVQDQLNVIVKNPPEFKLFKFYCIKLLITSLRALTTSISTHPSINLFIHEISWLPLETKNRA